VSRLFSSLLHLFLSWWGAFLFAALDSTLLFFAPFGIDVLLVYLVAREPDQFWLFTLLTAAGSVTGAAVTYWLGVKIGEKGLPRFISPRRLERFRARVNRAGAAAMAATAILPPPFPMSAFVLTCGAFHVSPKLFFSVFAGFDSVSRPSLRATTAKASFACSGRTWFRPSSSRSRFL
jgi:membrane protein YqaA with SNARE-associated domain